MGDNIIRRMGFVCWVNKATNPCSEYVILYKVYKGSQNTSLDIFIALMAKAINCMFRL